MNTRTAKPLRRIVTGHNKNGRAVIIEDRPAPRVLAVGPQGPVFTEVWNTRETPARIDRAGREPSEDNIVLTPPRNGTRIRLTDFPPESSMTEPIDAATARKYFERAGAGHALRHDENAPHPLMHRTETIDYGIVLEGEITLIVDEGETVVRAGDIVIQRGTNHAWANRSNANCRVAFVLIDGAFDADVQEKT